MVSKIYFPAESHWTCIHVLLFLFWETQSLSDRRLYTVRLVYAACSLLDECELLTFRLSECDSTLDPDEMEPVKNFQTVWKRQRVGLHPSQLRRAVASIPMVRRKDDAVR